MDRPQGDRKRGNRQSGVGSGGFQGGDRQRGGRKKLAARGVRRGYCGKIMGWGTNFFQFGAGWTERQQKFPNPLFTRDHRSLMQKDHLTPVLFSSLGLTDSLLESLEDAGFAHCTPIQAATLPLALKGQDIAGQAQTGTGKTAAFLLATLHYLMETPAAEDAAGPWAIVLAPTRELAVQIHRDAELIGRYTGLRFAAVFGGTGYDSQRRQLEAGVDVLIGTPGRLIDYFKQGVYRLSNVEVVVLDEADRMFDLGFIADIRYLLRKMPPAGQRINMLFFRQHQAGGGPGNRLSVGQRLRGRSAVGRHSPE